MLQTTIPVVVVSVKPAKEAKKHTYAEFAFIGGGANLPISEDQAATLQPLVGKETIITFEIKPEIMKGNFDRPETLLKFIGVLSISDGRKPLTGQPPK